MRVLLFLLVISLAACGQGAGREPFVDSRLPPNLEPAFWAPEGWAWGLIEPRNKPALRYGVAAPRGIARGQVVILTGYGQTAEAWFETARALVAADFQVWVLEPAGQGGSGRYTTPRDIGSAPDFEADVATLGALARQAGEPLFIIADGSATPAAIDAMTRGLEADTLVLSGPLETPGDLSGLGARWTRPAPGKALSARQTAQQGWMFVNPDLRSAAPDAGWRAAYRRAAQRSDAPNIRAAIQAEVLIIAPGARPADCAGFRRCRTLAIPAALPYPMADDPVRKPWLAAILKVLTEDHGA